MKLRTLSLIGGLLAVGVVGGLTSARAQTGGVTATFSPTVGALTVIGTDANDQITVGTDGVGQIVVYSGTMPVSIAGGAPTLTTTSRILVFGHAGDDELIITPSSSVEPLPSATIFGGLGSDTIVGGVSADILFGEDGNDTLRGGLGIDEMFGGPGNDQLNGGDGNDLVFGDAGDDRTSWNPGDDNDLMEGGNGNDALDFNGANAAEIITVNANGTRIRLDRNIASISLDIGSTEAITVTALGGDDTVAATDGLAGLVKLTFLGGANNDTLLGSDGPDVLNGGDGNDTIMGNGGVDTALMGAGDDVFIWDANDGNDVVDGEADKDTFRFTGDNSDEAVDISARGTRVRFFRDALNVAADLGGVEVVEFIAQNGTDSVNVKDLAATGVTEVAINLERQPGSPDGQVDSVTVTGTNVADTFGMFGLGANDYLVTTAQTSVRVVGSEAHDQLLVTALRGDDTVVGGSISSAIVKLTIDAGPGNDTVSSGQGADTVLLGAGNDTFVWDPGDNSDVVEGGADRDVLRFNGSNAGETMEIGANGARVRFVRNIGTVTLDIDDIEDVAVTARGGADTMTVNDLTGTDVRQVSLSLEQTDGTADALPDMIYVVGSALDNIVKLDRPGALRVAGLTATVNITGTEVANDQLTLALLDGNDRVDASTVPAGVVRVLTLDGGVGDDRLVGSAGDDVLDGGPGVDTLDGRDGTDTGLNGEVVLNIP